MIFLGEIPPFDSIQTHLYSIRRQHIPSAPPTQAEFDVDGPWFTIGEETIVLGKTHIKKVFFLVVGPLKKHFFMCVFP